MKINLPGRVPDCDICPAKNGRSCDLVNAIQDSRIPKQDPELAQNAKEIALSVGYELADTCQFVEEALGSVWDRFKKEIERLEETYTEN